MRQQYRGKDSPRKLISDQKGDSSVLQCAPLEMVHLSAEFLCADLQVEEYLPEQYLPNKMGKFPATVAKYSKTFPKHCYLGCYLCYFQCVHRDLLTELDLNLLGATLLLLLALQCFNVQARFQ